MAELALLGTEEKLVAIEAAELATDETTRLLAALEAEFIAGAAFENAAMNTAQTMAFANGTFDIVKRLRCGQVGRPVAGRWLRETQRRGFILSIATLLAPILRPACCYGHLSLSRNAVTAPWKPPY